jgi:F-type H+-transporting ATPase subunit alpha
LFIASHSSSAAYLSYLLGLIGLSLAESFMEKGSDVGICLDDLSKHSKSYRQISLIIGKIPSRDAFPADIFNVHSALLERCGKMKVAFGSGSCTAFPVIETINSDITEFIATNVISITDGQIYMNRRLFLEGIRPSIDSALSVSRIGSAAQCKLMKLVSSGIKNRVTGLRLASSGSSTTTDTSSLLALQSFNSILYQDHLIPVKLEFMMVLLLLNRAGFLFSNRTQVHTVAYLLSSEYLPFFYLVSICKSFLNPLLLALFMEYTAILTSSL